MSHLDNINFALDMPFLSSLLADNMELIMPIVVVIVGVLLAGIVVDTITDAILKVMRFVIDSGQPRPTSSVLSLGLDNDLDFGGADTDFDFGQPRPTSSALSLGKHLDFGGGADTDFDLNVFDNSARKSKAAKGREKRDKPDFADLDNE